MKTFLAFCTEKQKFTREKSYLQALKAGVEQYVYSLSNNLTFLHRYSNGMCGHDEASSGMSGHHYERVTIRSDRTPGGGCVDFGFNTHSSFRKASKVKYGNGNRVQMFYSADKYYRRQLELLKEEHPESYGVIEEFAEDMLAEGLTVHRMYSYILWLRKIFYAVDKKIDEWDRIDVRRTINHFKADAGEFTKFPPSIVIEEKGKRKY